MTLPHLVEDVALQDYIGDPYQGVAMIFDGVKVACCTCRLFTIFPSRSFCRLAQQGEYCCLICQSEAKHAARNYFKCLYRLHVAHFCSREIKFRYYDFSLFVGRGRENLGYWVWSTLDWLHGNLSIVDVTLYCRRCDSKWGDIEVDSDEYAQRRWELMAFGCWDCGLLSSPSATGFLFDSLSMYNKACQGFLEAGFNGAPIDAEFL